MTASTFDGLPDTPDAKPMTAPPREFAMCYQHSWGGFGRCPHCAVPTPSAAEMATVARLAADVAAAAQPAEPTQSTMSSDMASQAQEILRDAERNRYREQPAEPPAPDDLVDDALSWGALWRECNRWKEDSQAQAKTIARLGATAEDRNVVDQLRHDAYERDIAALRAENERQAREIAEHKRDREARNKIDPVTRLHNLCDGLAEHRRESPYDEESWRLADESYQKKCKELTALQAKVTQANRIIAAADAYFDYLHSPAMWEGFNAERLRNEYRAERAEWKP